MRPIITGLKWATGDNYASGVDVGKPTKVPPSGAQRVSGHIPDTAAAAQHQNSLLHDNGEINDHYKDIDWLNWYSVRVQDFSNDAALTGNLQALAYRVGLDFDGVAALKGQRWLGVKSGVAPVGVKSEDLLKWNVQSLSASQTNVSHPKSVIFSPTLGEWVVGYVTTGDEIATSPDGVTWTPQNDPVATDANRNGIADNGTIVVMCRETDVFLSTTTVAGWTERTHTAINKVIKDVVWSAALTLFCAVGNAGTILTSADGITWFDRTQARFAQAADKWDCIVSDGVGTLIAVGKTIVGTNSTVVMRSLDGGINWEFQHMRGIDSVSGCVLGQGRVVVFGTGPENLTDFGVAMTMRKNVNGL